MKKFLKNLEAAAQITLLIIIGGAVFLLPWAMIFQIFRADWLAFAACVVGEVLAITALNYILESK